MSIEWISVEDRLPDGLDNVLAADYEYGVEFGGDLVVAFYNGKFWCAATELLDASNHDGGALVELHGQTVITHWQPLPSPPSPPEGA